MIEYDNERNAIVIDGTDDMRDMSIIISCLFRDSEFSSEFYSAVNNIAPRFERAINEQKRSQR